MTFVFLRMLRSVLRDHVIGRVVVMWDGGIPAFRREVFSEYKAKRLVSVDDPESSARRAVFEADQALLKRVLPYLGVDQRQADGWEADDLLAFWALRTRTPCMIYSGDRDMYQLVSSRVSVLDPRLRTVITPRNFRELTGLLSPSRWLLYRVLTGDGSDGIPGVGGVGKTRGKLIANHEQPWPHSAVQLFGKPWVDARTAKARRNNTLMSLMVAAGKLDDALYAKTVAIHRIPAQSKLSEACSVLEEHEMYELTSDFPEWVMPYTALEAHRK